jgi:hypothetical protein
MKSLRDHFFASAMLAGDKDIGVGGPDLCDQLQDWLHYWRFGDKPRTMSVVAAAQQLIFHLEALRLPQSLPELHL